MGDFASMSFTLFEKPVRKARIQHRCIWCGQPILIGERYLDERSVYDGYIQRHRWHPECDAGSTEYFREGEETFDAHENERGKAWHS